MKKNGTNGHSEINLIENVDYFNMADGLYLSIDALCKKYGIGKSTAYNKARDNNLSVRKIAGVACFLDHKGFERQERVYNTKHLKPMTSHGELVKIVKEMNDLVLATNTRTFTHTAEIAAIRDKVNLNYQAIFRIESLVSEIIERLNK